MAASLLPHDRDCELASEQRRVEIQVENLSYDRLRCAFNRTLEAKSGIVDQNIDPAESIDRRVDHSLNLLLIPQIKWQQKSIAANFCFQFLQTIFSPRNEDKLCPFTAEG